MIRALITITGLLAAFLLPAAALAHHGWSEYDTSNVLKLTGKIVESGYEHPHGHIRLETRDKTWHVVLAPPSRMENRGLPKEWLKAGASATVEGYAPSVAPQAGAKEDWQPVSRTLH